ncbi:putative adenine phosphoribosyltransferase 1 [Coleophoma cylindrospora]|uniref:adenine phosphoribosyltransferase n=1 Tax=Coleophoma cylindrospora TaxID=1849047 RepID=A0A3D8S920_9HELO|nr:putative adenine phosphoribosyltransferase 1 [Coleophoma cylindrospora]
MSSSASPSAPSTDNHATASRSQSVAAPAASSAAQQPSQQLLSQKKELRAALKEFPDFPIPGIQFVDILPLFASPSHHTTLISALESQIAVFNNGRTPDVIVGLDARGFLFGPALALKIGAGFVPVRKRGKLPGPTEEAAYEKEYGTDFFQMQKDVIKPGQTVLVVDDIIATGGSAAAAGQLVEKLGGNLVGYLFILELDFLKGRDKLTAPVFTLLSDADAKA